VTAGELFRELAPRVGPALEREFKGRRDLCILATAIATDVADYFGIRVTAVPVQAMVYNDAWIERVQAGLAPEGRAWAIGIGYDPDDPHRAAGVLATQPNRWCGHLVAVADGYLGDFSIKQAERPDRDLLTGWAVVSPVPDSLCWNFRSEDGTYIEYRRIESTVWRRSPDWRGHSRRRHIVGRLIREVR